jgi:type IV secretion system protein VirB10
MTLATSDRQQSGRQTATTDTNGTLPGSSPAHSLQPGSVRPGKYRHSLLTGLPLCLGSGGEIRCTIADDIWSASGNTKLIEKGTTATGIYQTGAETGMTHGQGRAFLIITKLRTRQPPYLDIPLVDTRAAGELGEAGVDGWIDSHFRERFGAHYWSV